MNEADLVAGLDPAVKQQIFDLLVDEKTRLIITYLQKLGEATAANVVMEFLDDDKVVLIAQVLNRIRKLEAVHVVELRRQVNVDSQSGYRRRFYGVTELGSACLAVYLAATPGN